STEEKVKSFQMGIDDYLLKPFEMAELLERIRAVLRRTEGRRAEKAYVPKVGSPLSPTMLPNSPQRIPVAQAILGSLVAPSELPAKAFIPGISLVFLLTSLGLCYA